MHEKTASHWYHSFVMLEIFMSHRNDNTEWHFFLSTISVHSYPVCISAMHWILAPEPANNTPLPLPLVEDLLVSPEYLEPETRICKYYTSWSSLAIWLVFLSCLISYSVCYSSPSYYYHFYHALTSSCHALTLFAVPHWMQRNIVTLGDIVQRTIDRPRQSAVLIAFTYM